MHLGMLTNDPDPTATTRRSWFHDVHAFVVASFPVQLPPFKVVGHDVGRRCYVETGAVDASHSLDVAPHEVFAADTPTAGKMVNFLVAVEVLYAALFKQTRPEYVPLRCGGLGHVVEAGHLECVYDAVVGVG